MAGKHNLSNIQLMKPVNLQQTDFESEQDLRAYLTALAPEYASTMNRIEMETFVKSESEDSSASDIFEEYKEKYFCSDRKRTYAGKASSKERTFKGLYRSWHAMTL